MSDLVINHCSSQNKLFKNFMEKKDPGSDFFIFSKNNFEKYSKVVRPKSSQLSKKVKISGKNYYVWCTFGHDQIDFDFKNQSSFIFFRIIKLYLDKRFQSTSFRCSSFFCGKKKALNALIFRSF